MTAQTSSRVDHMKRLFFLFFGILFLTGCEESAFFLPLPEAEHRATPLHFGLYVTPDPSTNPIVPPERFTGFHVGTDFEVTEEELTQDVPVSAICTGDIAYSGFAEGYGGLIVQHCKIRKREVTILYGHVAPRDSLKKDETVDAGSILGLLAENRSIESDGNRKHLHLGIHHGDTIDMRGYVQTEEELAEFIDPITVLPFFPASPFAPTLTPFWTPEEEPEIMIE